MSRILPSDHEPVVPEVRRAFRTVDVELCRIAQSGCAMCGLFMSTYEQDHILPLELGGRTVLSNLQLLCTPCHAIKTAQDIKRIAKARRLRTPRKAPKRRLQSRGFDKSLHKHMNGSVTRG